MLLILWAALALASSVRGDRNTTCYPDLGCFPDSPCVITGTVEPLSSLDDLNIGFLLHTRGSNELVRYSSGPKLKQAISKTSFNPTKKSRFIIHGFLNNGGTDWLREMCRAMLRAEDENCFCIDWSGGAFTDNYFRAANDVRLVGAVVAQFIRILKDDFNYSLDLVHVIGHSLGAHVAGEVGKHLHGIPRITGLDPAEPCFEGKPAEFRLDQSDAGFVDVIHTDGSHIVSHFACEGFGMMQPVGHVDFYPNGGVQMAGCVTKILYHLPTLKELFQGDFIACNHLRSYQYYTESILSSDGFVGYPATSYTDFTQGVGFPCSRRNCLSMGHYADEYMGDHLIGKRFYLNTGKESPFSSWRYKITVKIRSSTVKSAKVNIIVYGLRSSSECTMDCNNIFNGNSCSKYCDLKHEMKNITKISFSWSNVSLGFSRSLSPETVTVQGGKDGRVFTFCGNEREAARPKQILKPCKTKHTFPESKLH